jgi:glycogen debranching enzyme
MGGWAARSEILAASAAVVLFMATAANGACEMARTSGDPQVTAEATGSVIDRFNEAFNRHDAEAVAALLTDDTVFEDTSPAPDGKRIRGRLRWWNSGEPGSRATLMQCLRRKT